ncbi:MAG: hypothetical protein J6K32_10420 [Clostridia bacterium]|nr:hypothetical protein [Clostridia bacterium]
MEKEIDILRLRLIIRGALDCLRRDSIAINEALTAQGKAKLNTTIESVETALFWMRTMIEEALGEEEK